MADSFRDTGNLGAGRFAHTATLLLNGDILVAGGVGDRIFVPTVELYQSASGTWKDTGSLAKNRDMHTATLLPNGKVLVVGGRGQDSAGDVASAELYDPATGCWSPTGSLAMKRDSHSATLLQNGKVLVAGGRDNSGLASAELYDPETGSWSATGSMGRAHYSHTATLLSDGQVLVAGGFDGNYAVSKNVELYDPVAGTWTDTASLGTERVGHTATLLANGEVLVAGGSHDSVLASAELYDPAARIWRSTGSLSDARYSHTSSLLPNGKVLVTGGKYHNGELSSAELYDPSTDTWTRTASLPNPAASSTATVLRNGTVLIAGGYYYTDGSTLYNPVLHLPVTAQLYESGQAGSHTLNISTRGPVDSGDRVIIGGFIITGKNPKPVVLRGMGPALAGAGVPAASVLNDPALELHGASGALIAANDNWKDGTQRPQIEGTVFEPADDREAVILTTLPPAAYTVMLKGAGGTRGVGLIEVYDNSEAADSELANISTRCFVGTGNDVIIGGFTLGGNNTPTNIAVRALGPSLTNAGLSDVMADPTLELHNAQGTLMVANEDWRSDLVSAAKLTANGLALPDPKECGIFTTLASPGQFTAIVAGENGGVGIALVEIYNLK